MSFPRRRESRRRDVGNSVYNQVVNKQYIETKPVVLLTNVDSRLRGNDVLYALSLLFEYLYRLFISTTDLIIM